MFFEHPAMLLWLPPLWGAIVLLYMLKLRRREVVVSSVYLWQRVVRDVQANAPFQKLRRSMLLLLQLLAAALLALALAHPELTGYALGGRTLVLVMDTGVTMQTADGSPTRLDAAKNIAHRLIEHMQRGDRMMLIAAGPQPKTVTGFTTRKARLLQALASLQAVDAPVQMTPALQLAADLARTSQNGAQSQIYLLSDGCFQHTDGSSSASTLKNLYLGQAHLAFYPVGKTSRNVAVTALDYRYPLSGSSTLQVLAVTHNFGPQTEKFVETVRLQGALVNAHSVVLPAHQDETETFTLPAPQRPSLLQVHLQIHDALAADNRAWLILRPRQILKILLCGPPDYFLQRAMQVDPAVQLYTAPQWPGKSAAAGFNAVVFNGSAPSRLPAGRYLFLHCTSSQCPAIAKGTQNNVSAIDWKQQSIPLRYVDLNGQRFDNTLRAQPAAWGTEIAAADSGSLIVQGSMGRTRALFFAFDPLQTRFPLTIGYPILLHNAVRWLALGGKAGIRGAVHTGTPVSIPVPQGVTSLKISGPRGFTEHAAAGSNGSVLFDGAPYSGEYTASAPGVHFLFAANLASSKASRIAPHASLPFVSQQQNRAQGRRVSAPHSLWPALALLGIALLVIEWHVFHKRVNLS